MENTLARRLAGVYLKLEAFCLEIGALDGLGNFFVRIGHRVHDVRRYREKAIGVSDRNDEHMARVARTDTQESHHLVVAVHDPFWLLPARNDLAEYAGLGLSGYYERRV